jgi:hypothetical protein
MEILEEDQEFLFVSTEDGLNLRWLLRIRDEYLDLLVHVNLSEQEMTLQMAESHVKPTLNTWNASNWMFLLLSRRRFIIIFKFASFAI